MQASIRKKKSRSHDLRDPERARSTPNLAFAGERLARVDLRVLARELGLEPRGAARVERALEHVDADTIAVILCWPLEGDADAAATCAAVRAALAERQLVIPVFAAVRDRATAAKLAALDLTDVFHWPGDQPRLALALESLLAPARRPRAPVREALLARVSAAFDSAPPSVAVDIDDAQQRITVAGNVASHAEMQRVLDVIRLGAHDYTLDNYLAIAPRQREQDSRAAARIEYAIARVLPEADVDVAVIGGRALLSGHVQDAQRADTLSTLVKAQRDVERVISRVDERSL
ncbi:MAG: BON domain-containing protein [Myxococcales bacterium]|nr:BON domain-containing protein [Myxococcales bacterium]